METILKGIDFCAVYCDGILEGKEDSKGREENLDRLHKQAIKMFDGSGLQIVILRVVQEANQHFLENSVSKKAQMH